MPKILDLFCKAGGCAMGYARAGFDIVGVDIEPQPRYPFPFVQADALTFPLEGFDVVHASPPCQGYSSSRFLVKRPKKPHRFYLDRMRERLQAWGGLWVLENVPGAPMQSGILLCGSMFDLPIRRHRYFECSHLLYAPGACHHTESFYNVIAGCVRGYGGFSSEKTYQDAKGNIRKREGHYKKERGQKAMGIEWMTVDEMSEAIPPAYTEFVGKQIMEVLVHAESTR